MINRLFLAITIVATAAAISASTLWMISTGSNSAYSQGSSSSTVAAAANQTAAGKTQAHTESESMMVSTHTPLTGQLNKGDYIHLIDFTPFKVSAEGHSHIAMKVPCDNNGNPKLAIIAGVAPDFKTIKVEGGGPILNGTLDGKSIPLSNKGVSCIYHGDIPAGATDIALVNTSGDVARFDQGGYGVTITAHAVVSDTSGDTDEGHGTSMTSMTSGSNDEGSDEAS